MIQKEYNSRRLIKLGTIKDKEIPVTRGKKICKLYVQIATMGGEREQTSDFGLGQ